MPSFYLSRPAACSRCVCFSRQEVLAARAPNPGLRLGGLGGACTADARAYLGAGLSPAQCRWPLTLRRRAEPYDEARDCACSFLQALLLTEPRLRPCPAEFRYTAASVGFRKHRRPGRGTGPTAVCLLCCGLHITSELASCPILLIWPPGSQ